jgi:hypothetical protein
MNAVMSVMSENVPEEISISPSVGRNRLVIFSGQIYELTLRVREGLPFIPYATMNHLVKSAMAQAQEITGITICHYLWMTNHAHMLVIVNDPEMLVKFYGIVKKSLTDHMKRLLGLRSLCMWEGRKVQLIPDLETMLSRIAYFYANPAKANLEDRIDDYRGLSSFVAFANSGGARDYEYREKADWVRPKYLKALSDRVLSPSQDRALLEDLKERAYYQNDLVICPNAWLKVFDVAPHRELALMQRALGMVKKRERSAREARLKEGKGIMGARILCQAIMTPCLPKKNEPGLFVISKDKWLRISIISRVREVRRLCYLLYHRDFKHGKVVNWPPGTFPPRGPMSSHALLGGP